ncbi:carboxypeptidase-like regulatory domain-containing protein [Nafulsella turpanensis]|uniref:carboxypeptidase-like regulatory domain-containing protein n=1 Tax=Nafulsella turpanensis TaxID=1265690 RepID=UPI00034BB2C7|nr:carboxypeptidase-like regulatory domain-containing protein [Nafulsella turpanensis]
MKLLMIMAALLLAVTKSCEDMPEQGLAGQVRWLEGNFMPTISENPEEEQNKKQGKPVQRVLHIYELTTMDEATSEGTFFHDIESKLVQTVETNKKGEFVVGLPPGRYSVFVKEEQGLFANSFDGEGNINPVTVKEGEITRIEIDINYAAAY